MTQFRLPAYLTDDDQPCHRVRCPIHGFIPYSSNERKVIDHHIVRRLRFIKQLALTDLLYPGAAHTRFEHSLGVMHVATLAFDRLASKCGGLLESILRKVEGFEEKPLAIARQALRLAALLHDVGHAPFSHAAESVIHKNEGHEHLTYTVLSHPDFLGRTLDSTFFEGLAEIVVNVVRGGSGIAPQLQVLNDIVAGQMDADRTDYLLRDSHHCGVEYGRFDYERMIESLTLIEGPGDSLEIGIDAGGIHTFEALILARYQMNTQVYYHRVRRIYDRYLRNYFSAKGTEAFDSPDKILAANDVTAMTQLLSDADLDLPESEWARRIVNRDHHRMIHETSEGTNAMSLKASRLTYDKLVEQFGDANFIWDHASKSIHNLLLPSDMEEGNFVQLRVVDTQGIARLIGEQSHILRHVPREFQVARVFCDVGSRGERDEIRAVASESYSKHGGRS